MFALLCLCFLFVGSLSFLLLSLRDLVPCCKHSFPVQSMFVGFAFSCSFAFHSLPCLALPPLSPCPCHSSDLAFTYLMLSLCLDCCVFSFPGFWKCRQLSRLLCSACCICSSFSVSQVGPRLVGILASCLVLNGRLLLCWLGGSMPGSYPSLLLGMTASALPSSREVFCSDWQPQTPSGLATLQVHVWWRQQHAQ